MTTFTSVKDQVESLYVGYFGRTDDGAGASYWANQIESGAMTLAKMAASFAVQPEALAKYSYLSAPSTGSPTEFINQVYHQLFNHDTDAAGLAYWTTQLAAASGSPQAIGQFIGNVISGATGADDTVIRSKVEVPQDVTPKAPDIATRPIFPVAPQPPTEIVPTSDTVPPANGGGADYIIGMSSYFFTFYDVTNSRSVDTITLIGSVNMSAADYAHITYNHFTFVAA